MQENEGNRITKLEEENKKLHDTLDARGKFIDFVIDNYPDVVKKYLKFSEEE